MANLLEQAINCDDRDRAAKIIQDALGIENDDVINYCFPKTWPEDRRRLNAATFAHTFIALAVEQRATAETVTRVI
jgi:uncharacterized protein HemY